MSASTKKAIALVGVAGVLLAAPELLELIVSIAGLVAL